jgi:hypothetical protein
MSISAKAIDRQRPSVVAWPVTLAQYTSSVRTPWARTEAIGDKLSNRLRMLSIRPSNLRRARVLAHGATRHPITFASITPPIAELRHTPSLQWQRYGRRYVPLLSSHRSSRGRFVGGAPWSNSLKRYCRVAIVNIHCIAVRLSRRLFG